MSNNPNKTASIHKVMMFFSEKWLGDGVEMKDDECEPKRLTYGNYIQCGFRWLEQSNFVVEEWVGVSGFQ